MTATPLNQYPCFFDEDQPCKNINLYHQLCNGPQVTCEHLSMTTLKPSEVEVYAMMDSNCYRSASPCPKPEASYLRLIARWESEVSRSNTKYKKLTCELKSLDNTALSFPEGHSDGIFSVLDLVSPLHVFPYYPKADPPSCDNKSVEVMKVSESALRRIPVEIKVKVWKDLLEPGNKTQDIVVRVAVPPSPPVVVDDAAAAAPPVPIEKKVLNVTQEPGPTEVFISYAHEDTAIKENLVKYLIPLQDEGLIASWHDHEIPPGQEWDEAIESHLNSAKVILLLISVDFMASRYIYGKELKRAMERHEAKEARVIPVIIRHTDWDGAPFAKLQVLPPDRTPISEYADKDKWHTAVVKGLKRVIEELKTQQRPPLADAAN